jgi:hypothetical protein
VRSSGWLLWLEAEQHFDDVSKRGILPKLQTES